jgi:hypothetical protein
VRGSSNIADEVLIGQDLRAKGEQLIGGEREWRQICGLWVIGFQMMRIGHLPRGKLGTVEGRRGRALSDLRDK